MTAVPDRQARDALPSSDSSFERAELWPSRPREVNPDRTSKSLLGLYRLFSG
jgi:hypothetical protein